MPIYPVAGMLIGTALLGGYLLLLYLRKERKPVLIGVHLLLGLASLEIMVLLLRGTPNSDGFPPGKYGNVGLGLIALAVFIGFLAPILGRDNRTKSNLLMASHVSAGLAGIVLAIVWMTGV